MDNSTILIVMRLIATCIAIFGAIYLASIKRDGWGWLIFTAIILGSITYKEGN